MDGEPTRWKRMSINARRKHWPKNVIDALVDIQRGICPYCSIAFHSPEYRRGRMVRKTINIDHEEPWSFGHQDSLENLVACCSICNNIKSDFIFKTLDEARTYIHFKRKQKGYSTVRPKLLVSELREDASDYEVKSTVLFSPVSLAVLGQDEPKKRHEE
jgi:5-methylcytosine-specific restriction endonuclease McrA